MLLINSKKLMLFLFLIAAVALPVRFTSAQSNDPSENTPVNRTDIRSDLSDPSAASVSGKRALPSPSSNDWSGFYVGGYAGGNFGRASANTTTVFSPTGYFATTSVPAIETSGAQKLSPNGFNGGVQAGYNYQSGHIVIGGEVDFGAMTGKKSASTTTVYPCCGPTTFTITQSVKTNWLLTARPRVGFAAGHALFYATGGVAVTRVRYDALFTDTFATANESGTISKTKAGWTGGGGVEYKMGQKWSIKGEYLFADFRRSTTTSTNLTAFTPPIAFQSNPFTHSIYLKEHLLRFGVNYHF